MEEWFELMTLEASRQELKRVLECNQETSKYGLSLTEEEARELMACRKETLRESRRVEFAAGILPELIKEFCDSQFIQSGEYVDTLARLQEIFYLYKNESMDELTDGELLEIDFGTVYETMEIWLNEEKSSVRIAPPYCCTLRNVRKGVNRLTVYVANTLVHKFRDSFSATMPVEGSGLLGPVEVQGYWQQD